MISKSQCTQITKYNLVIINPPWCQIEEIVSLSHANVLRYLAMKYKC